MAGMNEYFAYGVSTTDMVQAAQSHADLMQEPQLIHTHPAGEPCYTTCYQLMPNPNWGISISEVRRQAVIAEAEAILQAGIPIRKRYHLHHRTRITVKGVQEMWGFTCNRCGHGAWYGETLDECRSHAEGHVTLKGGCYK